MKQARLAAWVLGVGAVALMPTAAQADPIGTGDASSYVATVSLAGTPIIPPTPAASATAFGDDEQTALPLDVDPVAIVGALVATASVHQESDLPSALEQSTQDVQGPYNARAVATTADAEVLVDVLGPQLPLLEADAIRAEAVAVCRAGTVEYSASSEVLNLVIAGQDPLSGPINDLVGQILDLLEPLAPVVDVDLNVVTETADGVAVDAIVVTVLSALDPNAPLVDIRLGHAEVSGVGCGDGAGEPECSNGVDDDGDGRVDGDDPDCHTDGDPTNPDSFDPNGSEHPECSNLVDDDGDGRIDAADPECHTDGDATNPDSFDPNHDDEGDRGAVDDQDRSPAGKGAMPNTGGAVPGGLAALLATGGLATLALRRRLA